MGNALEFGEPCLLIRIPKVYRPGMSAEELYHATRGVWRVSERRYDARYGLAVLDGRVIEAYEIQDWQPAGSSSYGTRRIDPALFEGRWEFTGRVAPESVRSQVVVKSVAHLFKRGNQNPISYLNC